MKPAMVILGLLMLGTLVSSGCGSPPRNLAVEGMGNSQAWFEKNWGKPRARSKRLFGGETWMYFHETGSSFPISTAVLAACRIRLDFTKEGQLEDSQYSGC